MGTTNSLLVSNGADSVTEVAECATIGLRDRHCRGLLHGVGNTRLFLCSPNGGRTSRVKSRSETRSFTAAASRPSSAVRPDASSLPASAPLAAGAVVPAAHAAFPQKEECVGAAKARSSEELGAAQQAHSDWAPADCSAAQSVYGWRPIDPDDCSARLPADDWASIPADHSAQPGPGERRHSLDALPAHWPLAEPRPDWLEGYKASLPVWPGRLPGRSMLQAWELRRPAVCHGSVKPAAPDLCEPPAHVEFERRPPGYASAVPPPLLQASDAR